MKLTELLQSKKLFTVAILLVITFALWLYFPDFHRSASAPEFARDALMIDRKGNAPVTYDIELALTPRQQAYGLMYRRSLPENAGMLFIYEPDQDINMWMKNTYIPLDMLYLRGDGVITKIITYARPGDLTLLSSDGPVRGVLELNAGDVERHSLKTGDKVVFSAFK